MYAIAILISTVTGLSAYVIEVQGKCDRLEAKCQEEKAQLQAEIKEVFRRQADYLLKQDSINRAQNIALAKIKKW